MVGWLALGRIWNAGKKYIIILGKLAKRKYRVDYRPRAAAVKSCIQVAAGNL